MTTPPAGQGKLLLYEQKDKPRPSPLKKQRSTNEPPTAVIQPGEATPTRIPQTTPTLDTSPSIIRKTSSAEYAERHARSQRGRRQPDPEPLPDIPSTSDPFQASEEIRLQPISPIRELGASTTGLLGLYWNDDRRQQMFRTKTPDLDPESAKIRTKDHPTATESPYERKIVVTRPTTPEPAEVTPVPTTAKTTPTLAHAPLLAVSQTPIPTIPIPIHYGTVAPVPRRIPTPPIRPPSPLPPRPPSPPIPRPP
jgi:hypothetical protein